jgi:MoaA/NifB/PqqE/SkfB family radical SAM enzyme
MKRPVAVVNEKPQLSIYWTLTDFCNFSCNYCPPFLHSGEHHRGILPGFPADEEIIAFLDRLEDIAKQRNVLMIISGGEPTLHPMMPYIIKRLREINCYTGITTNGSKGSEFWKDILPVSCVSISLHPEFTKPDKINRISKVIVDSGSDLNYNLSCDPDNWEKTIALYEAIDDQFKPLIIPKVLNRYVSPIWLNKGKYEDRSTYDYTPEQKEWMNSRLSRKSFLKAKSLSDISEQFESRMVFTDGTAISANRLGHITINDWHNFEGWRCKAGNESLSVHFSGKVYAGVCKSKCLGTISDFELFDDYIICPQKRCICPVDIRVNKMM